MSNNLDLQQGPYRTTLTGVEITRQSTHDEWRRYGNLLKSIDEAKQWAIGDWLVDGKSHYGDGLYQAAAEITGLDEKYLSEVKRIAETLNIHVRRGNVSFEHHRQVASLKTLEEIDGKLGYSKDFDSGKAQEILLDAGKEIQRADGNTRKLTVKEVRALVQAQKQKQDNLIATHNTPDKVDLIYVDPPWQYDFPISGSRKIEHHHYDTMTYDEIKEYGTHLPIADNAVCVMWAPASFVHKALGALAAWGFEYRTTMVWIKESIGLGQWARSRHEFIFIGTKGDVKTPADADKPDSVLEAPRREHSRKPDVMYEILERMFPEMRKGEAFAREEREGWQAFGNETSKFS